MVIRLPAARYSPTTHNDAMLRVVSGAGGGYGGKGDNTTKQQRRQTMSRKGFANIQKMIAKKEGIPMKNAGAILASSSRKASPAAKRKNPNLKKVLGK